MFAFHTKSCVLGFGRMDTGDLFVSKWTMDTAGYGGSPVRTRTA
jgi:hypothetical protein